MSTVQIYYKQPEGSNWLEAFAEDNGSIDPRTLEIHQVKVHRVIITPSSTYHPHLVSLSEQRPSKYSRRSSLDLQTLGPLRLEHEPPVPTLRSESSIHRLYSTIRRHAPRQTFTEFLYEEGDSASLSTNATDSEYENCLLPYCGALPQPSGDSPTAANVISLSPSSSTNLEPQWLPLVIARVVSSKARKAGQALKKRFGQ